MAETKTYVDPLNGRSSEYRQKLQIIADQGIDPFAQEHLEKFDKKEIILETDHWFTFVNQHTYPNVELQLVIVSKRYVEHFNELSPAETTDFFHHASKLCLQFKVPGGGISMRFGDTALSGATVKRLHGQLTVPLRGKQVSIWLGSER